ncbi:MAG: asparaginase [Acidimicrobiia bacterium]|nr:asparaginase [Acidimicrobiia bacterium]
MRIAEKREGVTEGVHEVSIAVVDGGNTVFSSGDVDRIFYSRSTAKPIQAWVCQMNGAALHPLQLALATASHQGFPVHVSLVKRMLDEVGAAPSFLQCPPVFPWADAARDIVVRAGARQGTSLWHNCSGKHAAMVRSSLTSGWDAADYLRHDHPLQAAVRKTMTEVTGQTGDPVAIDGCGAPVTTVSTIGLARAYWALGNDPVFEGVVEAMHRYPGLTRGVGTVDDNVARWWNAVAKIGAMGCIGVAFLDGVGIAAKCWDGSERAVGTALMETLERVGLMTDPARKALEEFANPPVLGGGKTVGRMEVVA